MNVEVFLASRPKVPFLTMCVQQTDEVHLALQRRCDEQRDDSERLLGNPETLKGIFCDGEIDPKEVPGQPWRCRRDDLRRVLLVACHIIDGEIQFLATEICFASASLARVATDNGFPKRLINDILSGDASRDEWLEPGSNERMWILGSREQLATGPAGSVEGSPAKGKKLCSSGKQSIADSFMWYHIEKQAGNAWRQIAVAQLQTPIGVYMTLPEVSTIALNKLFLKGDGADVWNAIRDQNTDRVKVYDFPGDENRAQLDEVTRKKVIAPNPNEGELRNWRTQRLRQKLLFEKCPVNGKDRFLHQKWGASITIQKIFITGYLEVSLLTMIPLKKIEGLRKVLIEGPPGERQVIFSGSSGTGKTFVAKALARALIREGCGCLNFVKECQKCAPRLLEMQMSDSSSYSSMIYGARVVGSQVQEAPGALWDHILVDSDAVSDNHDHAGFGGGRGDGSPNRKRFKPDDALKPRDVKNVKNVTFRHPTGFVGAVIDELNRCKAESVFGELLQLLEYRHSEDSDRKPGDKKRERKSEMMTVANVPLKVPENFFMICTMNMEDKSLSYLDQAFLWRFKVYDLLDLALGRDDAFANQEKKGSRASVMIARVLKIRCGIERNLVENFLKGLTKMNERLLGVRRGFEIGHARFLSVIDGKDGCMQAQGEQKEHDAAGCFLKNALEILQTKVRPILISFCSPVDLKAGKPGESIVDLFVKLLDSCKPEAND